MFARIPIALTSLVLMSICGCGGGASDGPDLHPVSGKLTKGGEALANVNVTFEPTAAGQPSSLATTGEDGTFKLTTSQGSDGAVSGQHKIVLSVNVGESAYTGGADPSAATEPGKQDLPFPESFLTAETTSKEVTVKDGENDISIDVSE